MKYAQGYRRHFPSYTLILIASLVLGVTGCGGPDSVPVETAQPSQGTDSPTAETPPPPGGMELPSNLDVSDAPAANAETGTAFELPE